MDKKTTDAEIKMRYQYSVRVLKTCVDVPDQVKEATEILKELAEGGMWRHSAVLVITILRAVI